MTQPPRSRARLVDALRAVRDALVKTPEPRRICLMLDDVSFELREKHEYTHMRTSVTTDVIFGFPSAILTPLQVHHGHWLRRWQARLKARYNDGGWLVLPVLNDREFSRRYVVLAQEPVAAALLLGDRLRHALMEYQLLAEQWPGWELTVLCEPTSICCRWVAVREFNDGELQTVREASVGLMKQFRQSAAAIDREVVR